MRAPPASAALLRLCRQGSVRRDHASLGEHKARSIQRHNNTAKSTP